MIRDGYIRNTQYGISLFTSDGRLIGSADPGKRGELLRLAQSLLMTLPVTPYNSPDRFTEKEKAMFDAGECGYQIAYGMPWTEYCKEPSNPAADFGYCTEHATEE